MGLAEARKTKFEVQTLSGLKQYLAGYQARRQRQEADRARQAEEAAKAREESERIEFDRHRRAEALRVFAALGQSEQDEIVAEACRRAGGFPSMADYHKGKLVAERYASRLPSFEEWKTGRSMT